MVKEKKKREFPDVYALLFCICLIAMAATWIVPAGTFDRVLEGGINKVVAGSFKYVEANPQTPWDMMQSIHQGFVNSANNIFMIFFCGSAIGILEESKALSAAFTVLARKLKGKEFIVFGVIMYALALGNTAGVFGSLGVAIITIGIFLSKSMGGDAFLGFLIIYYGLMSGMAVSFANPSIVGIAQTIAELPIFSGTPPRAVACIINITFLYLVTIFYWKKIRKDPTKSLNYEPGMKPDEYMGFPKENGAENGEGITLTKRQSVTIAFFMTGVAACVFFTIRNGWGMQQIAACFLSLGIISGIISGFSVNQIARIFIKGCLPMVYTSFVVGLATAVSLILSNGLVIDTIVNTLSIPLNYLGATLGAGFMVIINTLINFIMPSGAAQATVVMPLMVPLADLSGITRQVAVQAFQFGAGFADLATPLNGPLMGCLAMAGISFPKYIKWAYKFIVIQVVVSMLFTMGLQMVHWTGL